MKTILTLLAAFLLVSCSSGGGDTTPPPDPILSEEVEYGELIVECEPRFSWQDNCTKDCIFNVRFDYSEDNQYSFAAVDWSRPQFSGYEMFDPSEDNFNDYTQYMRDTSEPVHIMVRAGTYEIPTEILLSWQCEYGAYDQPQTDEHYSHNKTVIVEPGSSTVLTY